MSEAFILEALRTPMGRGKATGSLATLHPVDLLGGLLATLVGRSKVDAGAIDDVITGCVSQVGEQTYNVGRSAVLAAGFPEHVPGVTIDRQCGSSQQAVHFAAQGIKSGEYDLVVACGVESMSHVALGSSTGGQDPFGNLVTARYSPGLIPQGISAELIATKWGQSREQLDEYSARSHQLAAESSSSGLFEREMVPQIITNPDGTATVVDRDEGIRASSTAATLGALKPAFASEAWNQRFPEIEWKITAGSSSQITDGAAAILLASAVGAKQSGLKPRARVHTMAVTGDDPVLMLTGPIAATRKAIQKSGLALDDIGLFEVNEAFASVVLAWLTEIGADPAKVNVNGGAIALGHPLGASGARLMTTMIHAMEERGVRYGLQTMCEGGGTSNATIIELLD